MKRRDTGEGGDPLCAARSSARVSGTYRKVKDAGDVGHDEDRYA